ncbi:hypothetical protein [Bifidobacterium longum]|uniref:hypothetical protein n=1 Tax=Bifidobacterium longum TaxID=216816 RepID=UPI00374F6BA1
MTYWTLTDPVLDIKDDKGTITATAASKGTMLIAGNSKTVALGPGGMALAPGLPLGLGWFIRRRLGLDASDILDRKLGLK